MTELVVPEHGVSVEAPATTANLGPAFDSVGLALDHFAHFSLASIDSVNSGRLHSPDLATASFRRRLELGGLSGDQFTIRCDATLPQGMGLGSSASAIVAGQLIGAELLRHNGLEHANKEDLLNACIETEGHPDNVAPCLFGGVTVTLSQTDSRSSSTRTTRFTPHTSIVAHMYLPSVQLETKQARTALPENVSHRDAAANSARAFQLGIALTQSPHLLLDATRDYLHQDYRRQLYPNSWQVVTDLRAEGHAAFISGGGPAVMVLAGEGTPSAPDTLEYEASWVHEQLSVCLQGAAIRVPSEV